jgi:prepilin-type N-terminal cleavage/methylation domain-containing protein
VVPSLGKGEFFLMKRRGLGLIEIMIVVGVLAMLSAILVP